MTDRDEILPERSVAVCRFVPEISRNLPEFTRNNRHLLAKAGIFRQIPQNAGVWLYSVGYRGLRLGLGFRFRVGIANLNVTNV